MSVFMKIGNPKIDKALLHLDKFIKGGMRDGAKEIVLGMQTTARAYLSEGIAKTGGKETGNLSAAILAKSTDLGLKSIVRADLLVDMTRAPYAAWIEYGSRSSSGLPYSRSGNRDYTKSKFKGHRYLDKTFRDYKDGLAIVIAAKHIAEHIVNKKM